MKSDRKEADFFNTVYKMVASGRDFYSVSESFTEYYNIVIEAIKFFEEVEEYEKCAVLKENMDTYFEKNIPKNFDEALEYMFSIDLKNKDTMRAVVTSNKIDLFVTDLMPTIGEKLIDIWLLKTKKSPLVKFYRENRKISSTDNLEIAKTIVKEVITEFVVTTINV